MCERNIQRKEGTEGRKRKLYRETFFMLLVSCENVAEVAAYRLGTVESQMIGHDFFSNDIFLKDFQTNRKNQFMVSIK